MVDSNKQESDGAASYSFSNFFNRVEVGPDAVRVFQSFPPGSKRVRYDEISSVELRGAVEYDRLILMFIPLVLLSAVNFVYYVLGFKYSVPPFAVLSISLLLVVAAFYYLDRFLSSLFKKVILYRRKKEPLTLVLSDKEPTMLAMSKLGEGINEYATSHVSEIAGVENERLRDLLEQRIKLESEMVDYLKRSKHAEGGEKAGLEEKFQKSIARLEEHDRLVEQAIMGEGASESDDGEGSSKMDTVISITHNGYIKCLSVETYHTQRRGGRGITGLGVKEDDAVEDVFIASATDHILFFTDKGKVHWIEVSLLPKQAKYARGRAIARLLKLGKDEKITSAIHIHDFLQGGYLTMVTAGGIIKKTELREYSKPRRGGIKAIILGEGDRLVSVLVTSGRDDILASTKNGKAIRFNEGDVSPHKRESAGVRAIALKEDEVAGAVVVDPESSLLTITENGYGKRTPFSRYPLHKRAGEGVLDIKTDERNGRVVAIKSVWSEDEILSVTSRGKVIRTQVSEISEMGRNTRGVKIMNIAKNDSVVSVARIVGKKRTEDVFKKYHIAPPKEDFVDRLLKEVVSDDKKSLGVG